MIRALRKLFSGSGAPPSGWSRFRGVSSVPTYPGRPALVLDSTAVMRVIRAQGKKS